MSKETLIVLTGPTASGKSDCAIQLCLQMGGEVISADSMQLYRGMEILSAAPTAEERLGVPHHLMGILDPCEMCTASMYQELAARAVSDVRERGREPVLCGGSGLYIDALIAPMAFSVKSDETLHRALISESEQPGGPRRLHEELALIDPGSAARLHENDVRRVVRAIEVYRITGRTLTEHFLEDRRAERPYRDCVFALDWPREKLYERIDKRVDRMLEMGVVQEVEKLLDLKRQFPTAAQAIGFREIVAALENRITMREAVDKMKQASRNYAKRQLTWLRRVPQVHWLQAADRSSRDLASLICERMEKPRNAEG